MIAESLVGIAQLSNSAVAEGIETAEQLIQLQALGCKLGQGYHYSPEDRRRGLSATLARSQRSSPA